MKQTLLPSLAFLITTVAGFFAQIEGGWVQALWTGGTTAITGGVVAVYLYEELHDRALEKEVKKNGRAGERERSDW